MHTLTSDTPCVTCRSGLTTGDATQCLKCLAAGIEIPAPLGPPKPPAPAPTVSVRPVLLAIEVLFAAIKRHHPDMPRVVVTLGPSDAGKGGEVLGWHAPERWRSGDETFGEIMIGAEGLSLGALELLLTCLHEAGHALARWRKLKDTSNAGRYHNRVFAGIAREMGLEPAERPAPVHGFSFCTLPEATQTLYAPQIAGLHSALNLYRIGSGKTAQGGPGGAGGAETEGDAEAEADKPKPKRLKVICACAEPRGFHIVASVLERAPIVCGDCGEPFQPAA